MDERITNGYREDKTVSQPYRAGYLVCVEKYILKLQDESAQRRAEFITPEKLMADPEKYRQEYYSMLGKPLTEYDKYKDVPVELVEDTYVGEDSLCSIRRLRLDVGEGMIVYGLLFLPKEEFKAQTDKNLFVLYQHGGGGTPEVSASFYGITNYNYAPRRIVARGAAVFSPQLLLWYTSEFGDPYDRKRIDNALKQVGSSITALEVFCHMRCLDYFVTQPYCDPEHIGMAGLSYGGFYTLMTAAADTRIRSAYASCSFIDKLEMNWYGLDRSERNWSDWSWKDAANTFLDAEIAALVSPRAICFDAGDRDESFGSQSSGRELERAKPYFSAQGVEDKIFLKTFDGTHETDKADDCLEFLFRHL